MHVHNFKELHDSLSRYRGSNLWIFRGHADPTWELIPKAGRPPFDSWEDDEYFRAWKRRAVELISDRTLNDWDWLAIAQDHGLPTRLLDWTLNPLAAAFFAVESEMEHDAIIFASHHGKYLDTEKVSDPFYAKGVSRIRPRAVIPRLVRQAGLFTIHSPPTASYDKAVDKKVVIEKIIVNSTYVRELKFELSHYGVNRMSLFPDLDGLSDHIRWHLSNRDYWKKPDELDELG